MSPPPLGVTAGLKCWILHCNVASWFPTHCQGSTRWEPMQQALLRLIASGLVSLPNPLSCKPWHC